MVSRKGGSVRADGTCPEPDFKPGYRGYRLYRLPLRFVSLPDDCG
jgi:hypothetical protein